MMLHFKRAYHCMHWDILYHLLKNLCNESDDLLPMFARISNATRNMA